MLKTVKHIVVGFVLFIVGFAIAVGVSIATKQPRKLYEAYAIFKNQQQTLAEIQKAEEVLRNDTYGGSTPEETFAMFLDALKAGDIDLASKYFVVSKQEEWRESLGKIHDGGALNEMVNELTLARENWKKNAESLDYVFFTYATQQKEQVVKLPGGGTTSFPAGAYGQTISFSRNVNQKWKINKL